MAVRPFWIVGDIDGRRSPLTGGPISGDGGFSLSIYQRVNGASEKVATIWGTSEGKGGKIKLRMEPEIPTDRDNGVVFEQTRLRGITTIESDY